MISHPPLPPMPDDSRQRRDALIAIREAVEAVDAVRDALSSAAESASRGGRAESASRGGDVDSRLDDVRIMGLSLWKAHQAFAAGAYFSARARAMLLIARSRELLSGLEAEWLQHGKKIADADEERQL